MKHLFILSTFACLLLSSCGAEDDVATVTPVRSISAKLSGFINGDEDESTRTQYSISEQSGFQTLWATGDVLGIYPIGGDQVSFPISQGVGTTYAYFDGGSWALRSNVTYAAYYPFSTDFYTTDQTALPVNLLGQAQTGNNTTTHLAAYDFMAAAATQPTASGGVSLQFEHIGCFLRMQLTMPVAGTFTECSVTTNSGTFTTKGTVNLAAATPALTPTATSQEIILALNNISTSSANQTITLYMMVAPGDYSGKTLTFKVKDSNNAVYSKEVTGKKWLATKAYNYALTLEAEGTGGGTGGGGWASDDIPYVTFTSSATQTLQMSQAVATLEYSVNNGAWATLSRKIVTFGGTNGDLRLRGKSLTGTKDSDLDDTGSTITFGNNTIPVFCNGDIRTLVDYENWQTANTTNAGFARLFLDCKSLKSAPSLPATSLSECCYYMMFFRCTSLSSAPELPATTLAKGCYYQMFYECTSLYNAPDLPATTLAEDCYNGMFVGCKSLTSAPSLPATILQKECYKDMFYECTSLYNAPDLPATTLADLCYFRMFYGCTNLSYSSNLPATTMPYQCCYQMFYNCTSLSSAPELPATTLAEACYCEMFYNCTSLSSAPELPATTLAKACYKNMFYKCTDLSYVPDLPATTLEEQCYNGMFVSCTSLTSAPSLPATTLVRQCYDNMFNSCINLSKIKMMAIDISAYSCLTNWVKNVSNTGTFIKSADATWDNLGVVPGGIWSVRTL